MQMAKIKVLVVDDSLFMRKLIARLVEEDPQLQVVGAARNGEEAVRLTGELLPDVITMDVEMPVMNGLAALTRIMEERPTPVVMLSSLTQEGAHETIDALRRGAVDFVAKPSGSTSADLYKVKGELLAKIKSAAGTPAAALRPFAHARKHPSVPPPRTAIAASRKSFADAAGRGHIRQLIAIGTSTGGPRALDAVLGGLPADFPHPIVVVQHMPPKFTKSLAQRLDSVCRIRILEAEDGMRISGGIVYIAPGNYHMTIVEKNGDFVVRLNQEGACNGHRPSVDVLFASIAKLSRIERRYTLVLMTGMGSDGAKGMLLVKESGGGEVTTLAEAQETCVVFGMPRAAIELGCVDHIVPLERICAKLLEIDAKPQRP